MILHASCRDAGGSTRAIGLALLLFASVLCICACSGAIGDDFAPFVIPARPNPDSPIAAEPGPAIAPDSKRLVVSSGHFYRGDEQVRLWGVNLSFGANLPAHEDAPHIAARLAAAGVNTVRCHHLDTAQWPRGVWNAGDGKTITPEALDRLDYFIDQLARRGICVNLNLHVGRAHSRYIGLPETNRQYDKISNIFTPELIEAQKQYARELLGRENAYRKVRYADDPAVALVEITNENSFFMWSSEETLRTLPTYYADILQGKFNAWLGQRYGSNETLRKAWSEGVQPLGPNVLTNGDFRIVSPGTSLPEGWQLEQHSGCKASVFARPYSSQPAACIEIAKADQTEWHLQLSQRGVSVRSGQYYTVAFEAAAAKPRRVGCGVSQAHEPWANLGLSRTVELTGEWQRFRFGFVAKADDDNARISFAVGGSEVPVYLANVEFRPGGRLGLDEDESIDAGSVALFADNESPERILDRMRFLAETEKAYFDDMRHFIKNDLGCAALVTGTIVFGPLGLYAQSDMDFIDTHAYWQHPRFPGRPWDAGNWLISQKPMTDYP
ncbi:MAG: carbohydrate binding domain-containing protein, partial [Planctomycetota bacterium]